MSGELRIVGERGRIADHAIMRDVSVSQQPVAVAERGDASVLRGAGVDGEGLAAAAAFLPGTFIADRIGAP